ncbi:hypothetical protein [Bradyrhizobium neotropicale]|uniref:hypothetical protein n=1 Tax=Bradyrhizobium neotropicale TaxID=1497615 RepID=UPI001AD7B3BD|nr:hypothetical protein [Bradyrhizobium neotropicale]MBO4228372.1 hypothetical protein [Bradyrhizobium neotropicale]
MSEIVKVQLPLTSNDPRKLALVYAKGRKNMVQQPLDAITRKLMGADFKAFFEAEYQPARGTWLIGERVGHQDW